jgi:hypothetical protein
LVEESDDRVLDGGEEEDDARPPLEQSLSAPPQLTHSLLPSLLLTTT